MHSEKPNSVDFYLSRYPKPKCGKSSIIQKGLVPSRNEGGSDLCEEGLGIGVPLLQYRRDFYFPGTARSSVEGEVNGKNAWKEFELNLIDRHQDDVSAEPQSLSWVYQRLYNRVYKSVIGRQLIGISGRLARAGKVKIDGGTPAFYHVSSKGMVKATYLLKEKGTTIEVVLSFEKIDRAGLQKIYVSNELGGTLFDIYMDDTGLKLQGDRISGWERIYGTRARFYSKKVNLFFETAIPQNTEAYMGREIIGKNIRWSGVILALPPNETTVEYNVRIGAVSHWGVNQ